ncbi:MAG: glycosyl hydrolase-related protein [Candidatus Omnitrophica bacterium]|nr:glycosyl hydrolase-related protein [Candidatus Omnitrophota bacterium]
MKPFPFFLLVLILAAPGEIASLPAAEPAVRITRVEPTPLYPRQPAGHRLEQLARLHIENSGEVVAGVARITVGASAPEEEDVGTINRGNSVVEVRVADIASPTPVIFELRTLSGQSLAMRKCVWRPAKKWKVYNVAYSHHDMGYADYYQLMRRDVREMGIDLALEYCSRTDSWDKDSQYRWTVESSEPVAQWIRNNRRERVDELARRIREGRIELGAIHTTVNPEALNPELMARLFYTPNRYIVDMLDIPPQQTALLDDVTGLGRALPTYAKEAGIPFFYHGRNELENQVLPASAYPAYFWMGADGDRANMTLFTTRLYHSGTNDRLLDLPPSPSSASQHQGDLDFLREPNIEKWMRALDDRGWPYDCVLSRECWDFSLPMFGNSPLIRQWNQKWSYPRIISATLSMYMRDLAGQMNRTSAYVFDKDAPNAWADQHYSDFASHAAFRTTASAAPSAETLGTLAALLGAREASGIQLWQAYHNLLICAEHTEGVFAEEEAPTSLFSVKKYPHCRPVFYYETEASMHRAWVESALSLVTQAEAAALDGIDRMIPTRGEQTLVVHNPLARPRTDIAQIKDAALKWPFHLIDTVTDGAVPCQLMPGGRILFLAKEIPALGYKTFRVESGLAGSDSVATEPESALEMRIENQFYTIVFNPANGAVASLWDKQRKVEWVDKSAPYQVNEYLYSSTRKPAGMKRVQSAALAIVSGPVALIATAKVQAPGVSNLFQQVLLYHDLDRIDFVTDFEKLPSGRTFSDYRQVQTDQGKEAVFFAIPLEVPQFQIRHELAGAVSEPIAGQCEGSTTSYYGIQHFTDLSNRRYGATIGTVECGLVEYGTPRPSQSFRSESVLKKPEKSHVFLYPMNNWFFTNIQIDQRGPSHLRWSFRGHAGDWCQGSAFLLGAEVAHPLETRLISGEQSGGLPPARAALLEINPSHVVISTLKPAEANGTGLILRCNEVAGEAAMVSVTLPHCKSLVAAIETSLLEVDRPVPLKISHGNCFTFSIRPFGVKTVRMG